MPFAADCGVQDTLARLRQGVQAESPNLLALFDTFAAEAAFGRAWLEPHLARLPGNAQVLEVGAGLMLLSAQLAREGFDLTALEPVGAGFSDFHDLQAIIRRLAHAQGWHFQVLPVPVEGMEASARFDLAFSVNVMEHVNDVDEALAAVTRALKPGCEYAFTCPNYRFPYEPHFGLPIVGSKRLTGWLFGRAIRSSRRMPDPAGVWESLNWITVGAVDRACGRLRDVEWRYDRSVLPRVLERVTRDAEFAGRRAAWMRVLAGLLVASRIHRLGAMLPASLQPMIDCTVLRRSTR